VNIFVCTRVAFPSAEVRCIERDGTSEVIYGGIVPRKNAASLGVHSGTDALCCCLAFLIVWLLYFVLLRFLVSHSHTEMIELLICKYHHRHYHIKFV